MMESDTSGKESSDGQTPPKRNKNELPQKLSAEKRSEKSPNVFKGDTPKPERKRKTPTRPPRQLAPKRETGSIKKSCSVALKVLEKYKKRHKCDACGRRFHFSLHLNKHLSTCKRLLSRSNLIEKCLECGKKFASKHAMLKHKERKHNILECHICKRTHKAPGALEKHFRDKHLMEGPPYICSYCPFSNNSISLFILHTRTTHKIKELCPYCPGVFATKKSLCLHIISKHTAINATRLNCPICKASFASTHALKVHFKTLHSSTNKWFTCIHCETFVHEKQYGMHMRKHKHSLRCRLCQREFISHRSFHVHRCSRNIYTNRTRQRYTCETCGVKFGSKEVLEGHSYIHKFDVVYVCKICRKQISNILEVYMHGKQCPTPQTSIPQGSTNKRDASMGRRIDAKSRISTDKFKTVNSIVSAQKLSLAAGSQVVAKDDTNVKFNTRTSKLTRNFEIQSNQLVKKLESTSVLLKERDRIPTATISRTYSDQHTQVLTKASGHLTAKMSSLPIEHKIKTNRNIGAVGSSSPTVKAEKLSDSLRHNTPSKMSLIVSKLQLGDLANPKEVKLLTSTGSLITIKTGVSEMLKPKTKSTTEYPVTPKTTNDLVQGTGQSTAAQQIMVHQSRGKALQVLNTIKHIDRTIPKNKNTLFMNCQKCGLKCNSAKELSSHNCRGCKYIYICHRCTSIFLSESVFNLHSCQGATKPVTPAVEKNASSSTASEVKFHLKPEYFVYNTQSSCSGIPYLKSNKATATGSLTHASYKEIASVSSSVMQSDPNTKHKPKSELNSSDSTGSGSEVGFPCIPYQKVFKNKEILKNHNCRPRKVRNTTNKSSFKSAPSGEKGYSCSSQLQLSRSSQNTVYITDSNPGIDDATETRDANQFQSSQEAHPAEKFIEQSPFEIINISDGILIDSTSSCLNMCNACGLGFNSGVKHDCPNKISETMPSASTFENPYMMNSESSEPLMHITSTFEEPLITNPESSENQPSIASTSTFEEPHITNPSSSDNQPSTSIQEVNSIVCSKTGRTFNSVKEYFDYDCPYLFDYEEEEITEKSSENQPSMASTSTFEDHITNPISSDNQPSMPSTSTFEEPHITNPESYENQPSIASTSTFKEPRITNPSSSDNQPSTSIQEVNTIVCSKTGRTFNSVREYFDYDCPYLFDYEEEEEEEEEEITEKSKSKK